MQREISNSTPLTKMPHEARREGQSMLCTQLQKPEALGFLGFQTLGPELLDSYYHPKQPPVNLNPKPP